MYIVHVASELAPIAKVGGLGDVIHGLAKELVKKDHKVEILIPKYDCIDFASVKNLQVEEREVWGAEGTHRYKNTIWSGLVDGLTVFFIETHHPKFYFSRGKIYSEPDDMERFAYFSRVALEFLLKTNRSPDVLHIHDWMTALIAPLYKEVYFSAGLRAGGVFLTIHNLQHQGRCSAKQLSQYGLKAEKYLTAEKMLDPIYPHVVNQLKGGIVYADQITTVSPTYEKEIQTVEGGCGLHATLLAHRKKLKGILNGIDESYWNPENDPYLVKRYAAHHMDNEEKMKKALAARSENRDSLRAHFKLKEGPIPLCACVTRLVAQKGPALIKHAILRTLEKGGQFILLGSVPSVEVETEFRDLHKKLSKSKNFGLCLEKDEALAHQVFAGADMIIVPSLFEPCGLTQLIALRYGSVPIARMTGGLADTVFDIDTSKEPLDKRNGFTFEFPDAEGVNWALDRALACYKDQKRWQKLIQNGMNQDFSWAHSAKEYLEMYAKLSKKQTASQKLRLVKTG
jgi:starch synthase